MEDILKDIKFGDQCKGNLVGIVFSGSILQPYTLSITDVDYTKLTLSFDPAPIYLDNPLQYRAYYSTSDNLNGSPSDIETNGTLGASNSTGSPMTIDQLNDDTIYYVNVVVTDDQGDKFAYNSDNARTLLIPQDQLLAHQTGYDHPDYFSSELWIEYSDGAGTIYDTPRIVDRNRTNLTYSNIVGTPDITTNETLFILNESSTESRIDETDIQGNLIQSVHVWDINDSDDEVNMASKSNHDYFYVSRYNDSDNDGIKDESNTIIYDQSLNFVREDVIPATVPRGGGQYNIITEGGMGDYVIHGINSGNGMSYIDTSGNVVWSIDLQNVYGINSSSNSKGYIGASYIYFLLVDDDSKNSIFAKVNKSTGTIENDLHTNTLGSEYSEGLSSFVVVNDEYILDTLNAKRSLNDFSEIESLGGGQYYYKWLSYIGDNIYISGESSFANTAFRSTNDGLIDNVDNYIGTDGIYKQTIETA